MPKCQLTIELDSPDQIRTGGDTVTGYVLVEVDKSVRCDGLVVASRWQTHGKGNVHHDTVEETVVFQGDWDSGETHRYPFSLRCADWPPTYRGELFHVEHLIQAQANIPWAIDPKAQQPFRVTPGLTASAEPKAHARPTDAEASTAPVASFVAILVLVGVLLAALVMTLFSPFVLLFAAGLLTLAGAYWFVVHWLPRYKLGEVAAEIVTPHLHAGDTFRANLRLTPRSPVRVNRIFWRLRAEEVAVRGSGTDRRTYRRELVSLDLPISEASQLRAEPQTFSVAHPIAVDAPYSIDLRDNDVRWTAQAYVDIPNWPDWQETNEFVVRPHALRTEEPGLAPDVTTGAESKPSVIALFAKVRDHAEQREQLLTGVRGVPFPIRAQLVRRISVGMVDEAYGAHDDLVFMADHIDPPLPLLLYVPRGRSQELGDAQGTVWSVPGEIVGYDPRMDRLQIRVRPDSPS